MFLKPLHTFFFPWQLEGKGWEGKKKERKVSKTLVICLASDAGCSPIKFCFPKEDISFKLRSKKAKERKQTIKTFPGGVRIKQELQRSYLINNTFIFVS